MLLGKARGLGEMSLESRLLEIKGWLTCFVYSVGDLTDLTLSTMWKKLGAPDPPGAVLVLAQLSGPECALPDLATLAQRPDLENG